MLTKEQCDQLIVIYPPRDHMDGKTIEPTKIGWSSIMAVSIDEAELFFLRGLDAVKRARKGQGDE